MSVGEGFIDRAMTAKNLNAEDAKIPQRSRRKASPIP